MDKIPSEYAREEKLVKKSEFSELSQGRLSEELGEEVVVKVDLEPVLESIRDDSRERGGNVPFNLWMMGRGSEVMDVIPWNKVMCIGHCSCCGKQIAVKTYYWYLEVSCGKVQLVDRCPDDGNCNLNHNDCSRVHGNLGLLALKQYVAFEILKIVLHYGACIINEIRDTIMNDSTYMITKWMMWEGRLGIMMKEGKDETSPAYVAYDKGMEKDEDVKRVVEESLADGFFFVI